MNHPVYFVEKIKLFEEVLQLAQDKLKQSLKGKALTDITNANPLV